MNEEKFNKMMEHEQEIIKSRVGGFGGSDAALFLKVGQRGIESLSMSDKKRIAVMLGLMEYEDNYTSPAMAAGHLFEDYMERELAETGSYDREKVLEMSYTQKFKTFAHADFCTEDGQVLECKYSQKDDDEVLKTYYAQLQWYYMLGATRVALVHGRGSVEPFEVAEVSLIEVEKDQEVIDTMLSGIDEVAAYVEGFTSAKLDVTTLDEIDEKQRSNVVACRTRLAAIKEAENALARMREELQAYMEANQITKIDAGDCVVTYVGPTTRRTFDSKKAQATFPELKGEEFYKQSNVKATIKIELR